MPLIRPEPSKEQDISGLYVDSYKLFNYEDVCPIDISFIDTGTPFETCCKNNHGVTESVVLSNYDTVANTGGTNRVVDPVEGEVNLETYNNGFLFEWYDGINWIYKFFLTSLNGCSDEGTVTAIPTTVTSADRLTYIWDVDTTAGDIDFTTMAPITGVKEGANIVLRNTGENNILFDQDINGTTVNYVAQGAGSVLKLCATATDFEVIG